MSKQNNLYCKPAKADEARLFINRSGKPLLRGWAVDAIDRIKLLSVAAHGVFVAFLSALYTTHACKYQKYGFQEECMSSSPPQQTPSAPSPWWIRPCRVGWIALRFFWATIVLGVVLGALNALVFGPSAKDHPFNRSTSG